MSFTNRIYSVRQVQAGFPDFIGYFNGFTCHLSGIAFVHWRCYSGFFADILVDIIHFSTQDFKPVHSSK